MLWIFLPALCLADNTYVIIAGNRATMGEKLSKFDRETNGLRHDHMITSKGLELAQQLKRDGENSRTRLQEQAEFHRETIRQLDMSEADQAPHLASMAPEIVEADFPAQRQQENDFLTAREHDYDSSIDKAKKHYQKHKDKYLESALREAAEAGVAVSTVEAGNLNLIHNPNAIYPGLSENELAHLQHLDETLNSDYLRSLMRIGERHYNGVSTPESQAELREFMRMTELDAQVRRAMLDLHEPQGIFSRQNKLEHNLSIHDVPLIDERLEELGLDLGTRQSIFASWASCQPLAIVMEGSKHSSLRQDDIEKAAAGMADYLCQQLESVMQYAEKYGLEEIKDIVEIFGIHHFSRYTADQLHFQLTNWEDPKAANPVRHIVITTHDDWNTAMSGTGRALGEQLPRENTIFFEASSPTEMARQIVAVGSRERRAGRDPEKLNMVENVIITGHGSPELIVLGEQTGELSIGTYQTAAEGRERINARINTYRRHLGSNFQVILDSCSTAGIKVRENNIATEISDGHDTLVHASPVSIYGASRVSTDGEVVYKISPKNAWLTAASYDGRHGDGVTESASYRTRLARWAHFLLS